ncbi:hypothetical protein B0H16DRAFT_1823897 [Mycena metata]|uniref:F-box domain-containing protein n=1 Tax=Mycena metata TaxID=1033252 RepID=A0AAD7J9L1_9AGAR|nr:hypothetical protein B0H16DRAFT_1823897 [Mycena metata]
MSSFAVGPRAYQNQYNLANKGGYLRLTTVYRPILALPPEILAEIFVYCLPEYSGSPDPQDAPYLLCHVCRYFTEVAVSTPRLWSSLCVEFHHNTEKYLAFCRNGAAIWLSRARSLPLSLHFYRSKWRSLAIDGCSWANLFESGSFNGKVPLLENLSIGSIHREGVILHDAPKLCTLSFGMYPPRIQVPWHQLTTFHVRYIEIPSFLEVLQNSTNLLEASFAFFTPYGNDPFPLPVPNFRHARLQSLSLDVFDSEGRDERAIPMSLLGSLELPALNALSVALDWQQSAPVALSPLLSFLSQPALQLHTLALSFPHPPAVMDDLIKCLEQAPSLVDFKFRCPSLAGIDILFVQLTGRVALLPRLQHLCLVFSHDPSPPLTALTTSAVVEMLSWRWAALGITRLQTFGLLHDAYYNSPPAAFSRLTERGVRISTARRGGFPLLIRLMRCIEPIS